jgi:hypothetical protein
MVFLESIQVLAIEISDLFTLKDGIQVEYGSF